MKFILFFLLLPCFLFSNEEEALFVRRIEALDRCNETTFLKKHVLEFLNLYPQSKEKEKFHALLGNLAFDQMRFEEALSYFETIKNPEIKKEILGKKWHCQSRLHRFHELRIEILPTKIEENE